MRTLVLLTLAGFFFFNSMSIVDASRGNAIKNHGLEHIAETTIPSSTGGSVSLCHLVKYNTLFSIHTSTSSVGYALATDRCETSQYIALSASEFVGLQLKGQVSTDFPPQPRVSVLQTVWKYALPTIVALALFAALVLAIRPRPAAVKPQEKEINPASKLAQCTLHAICMLAKVNGQVEKRDARTASAICEKVTGVAFSMEKTKRMIDRSEGTLTPAQFEPFKQDLKPDERRTLMRGVLLMALSDGALNDTEHDFVRALAEQTDIHQIEIIAILEGLIKRSGARPRHGASIPAE